MTTAPTLVLTDKLCEVLESPPCRDSEEGTRTLVATRVVDSHCLLGECVVYDDVSNQILWTDILGKTFYALGLKQQNGSYSLTSKKLPKMLGSFCLTHDGTEGYLCAWQDGFQLCNIQTGTPLSKMSVGEPVNPVGLPSRLNDGRCDRTGKYYICGGHYGDMDQVRMKVHKCWVDVNGELRHDAIIHEVRTTNSLCFSPDGDSMYFCDSPTETIVQYKYNQESGDVDGTPKKVWKWTNEHENMVGHPDGSCVDSEGYIWNCLWRQGTGTSRVHRIHPRTGKVVLTIMLPDGTSQCTCCCFGGVSLDMLFMTTASVDVDKDREPHAGALYAIKIDGVMGLKESRFHC